MLLMFRVKNYMSFKDESILDMRATSYVQYPSHVIPVKDKKGLLKTVAMYGANASGKSNFISAMSFFERYIISQFINVQDDEFKEDDLKWLRRLESFALSEDINDVSEFEIVFINNGKQIQYGFECNAKSVLTEWLFIDDKKVFERGKKLSFGNGYKKVLGAYTKLPRERLYVAVLDYFLEEDVKRDVLHDFTEFFEKKYNVFTHLFIESTVKISEFFSDFKISSELASNRKLREEVEKYLRIVDIGIKGLAVETVTVLDGKTGEQKKRKIIRTIHDVYDNQGKLIGEKRFPLSKESSGTLNFIAYIQKVIKVVENGGVFICDEMSARLHPLLAKLIVDIFASNKNKQAQLIFTTHDVSLLNNNQFRRDEVVFIDKNRQGESRLYSLSDLKTREDASFSKDYLQGKYGAIPIINYKDALGGEDDA